MRRLGLAGAVNAKAQGKMTAANWVWAFALSVAAWFARIPVSEAAAQPDASAWWIGLEAGLVLTFLWGIENLVVAMLPMRFLDGPKVRAWSRPVWAVLLFLGIFGVVHVLLSPNAGYVGHTTNEVTIGVLVFFAIFGAVSSARGRTSGTGRSTGPLANVRRVYVRIGIGAAGLLAGLALILVGVRGGNAVLDPLSFQPVSETPQASINVNTSPVPAVHPTRPEVMVVAGRVDAPRLHCTVSVTTTGGEAWRALELPPAPDATNCFWPAVAFDGDGNLLVLYTPTGGPYNLPTALWLQRFTPALDADGPPVRVAGALTFQPRLAVEGRRVLVAWIAASEVRATKFLGFGPPPNPILLARSEDGGRTFAPPVTVGDPARLAVQPTLLAGPGGQIVVGALDLGQDLDTYQTRHEGRSGPPPAGPWQVVLWRSTDGGATFGPAATVAGDVVPPQRVLIDLAPAPAFALDPARDRIYSAWESGRDVLFSRSDDGGTRWSPPQRLGPAAGGQFLPGVGVAPDGRVDVAYYDRSGDPDDVLAEVVLASSTDGGRSFVSEAISDHPIDSMVGSFNGDDVMLGSHLAVMSRSEDATVVWPDTTRGNRVNNIVDLVSATVAFRPATGARVPLVVAGGVLLLGGVVTTALSWPGRGAGRDRRPARRRAAWPPPLRRG